MVIEYPYAQRYLFAALESGPALCTMALEGLTAEEADARPDPERFTLREILAHLAEWEPIFLDRMQRICTEDHPLLEGYDEGALAVEHRYDLTDPLEQLQLFCKRRGEMVAFLRSRTAEQWGRTGDRPEIGVITLEGLALLIPLHDTYHLRQIAEWRRA